MFDWAWLLAAAGIISAGVWLEWWFENRRR